METSSEINYPNYWYVIPLIIINLILYSLGMPWIEFGFVVSLITLIVVLITTKITLSDRRRKIIEELKQDSFIDNVILSLKSNTEPYEEQTPHQHQISTSYQNLNKFSRAYPFLGRKLKTYDKFCRQIDNLISDSEDKETIEQLRMELPDISSKLLPKFQNLKTKWITKL